jgi:hypothetical protein
MRRVVSVLFVLLFALLVSSAVLTGCSRSKSEKTVTTTSSEPDARVTETTTVEKTETSDGGCGGVLSCTVDAIGTVIALPFRAVGALFDAIF